MTRPAIPLYDYQRKWIADRSRFVIGMWSRQSGKTFTSTLAIVDDVYEGMTRGERRDWVILSRGEKQAAEAMANGVALHARAYGLAADVITGAFEGRDGTKYRELRITFPNGARVIALPANPDTARGYSAGVFLDEFARHAKSREIWAALFPTISAGYRIRIASTPAGKRGKFYEIMTSGADSGWSPHVVDIHRAVADGLPRDVEGLRRGLADEDIWRQEFECEWLDEASSWLDYDLIDACEHPDAGRPELTGDGPAFIGNDIGRRKDLWVAWVWELVGDVAWTREVRTLSRQALDELVARYRPLRIALDQTGMGEKPVEDAQRRYGSSRVEGVQMSAPRKLALADALRERMSDRAARLPAGDRVLRADLHSVRKEVGVTGGVRLLVGAEGEGDGSHADRFWAAALGCGAMQSLGGPIEGEVIPGELLGAFPYGGPDPIYPGSTGAPEDRAGLIRSTDVAERMGY